MEGFDIYGHQGLCRYYCNTNGDKNFKRALLAPTSWAIAGTGFCTITIRNLAYPWVVLTTEIWGALALPKGRKQKLTHRLAPNLQ